MKRTDRRFRPHGFTLVELLVVVAIIVSLIAILLPALRNARKVAKQAVCGSNLSQVGLSLMMYRIEYRTLPVRPGPLAGAHPHLLADASYGTGIEDQLEKYVGSRAVFYCPDNFQQRGPDTWWPNTAVASGYAVAITYQIPGWLEDARWLIPKPRDPMVGTEPLAADYLGSFAAADSPTVYNHDLSSDGDPVGANTVFGDRSVRWEAASRGWTVYAKSSGNLFWYLLRR